MPVEDATGRDGSDRPQAAATPANASPAGRVAVIVVHGVADQKPAETMQSVVELLVGESPHQARYKAIGTQEFTLRVDPLAPTAYSTESVCGPPGGQLGDVTPNSRGRPFVKSLAQSFQSDFHRTGDVAKPGAMWGAGQLLARLMSLAAPRPLDARVEKSDRGLEMTQYLLDKATRNQAPREDFRSSRVSMKRDTDTGTQSVDLYEMYWADLSRLASALPRIVTELLTMIFRLSRLGRDTVDDAAFQARTSAGPNRAVRRWIWLSTLQSILDWSFVHVLAQLYAQLLLLGVFVMAMGVISAAVTPSESDAVLSLSVLGLFAIVVALACLLYFSIGKARPAGIVGAVVVIAIGTVMYWSPTWAPFGAALFVFGVLSALGWSALRTADDRFPFVLVSGALCWVGVIGTALVSGGWLFREASAWWAITDVALRGVEWTLVFIKWWWIVVGPFLVLWVLATTLMAVRTPFEERASAATGRLGLLLSLATFLAIAMALWASLQSPLKLSVESYCYPRQAQLPANRAERCDASCIEERHNAIMYCVPPKLERATAFLDERFEGSTAVFAVIASLLIALLVFLIATILPSVLAELLWTRSTLTSEARRLGRWLTVMYRLLDSVILVFVLAGATPALVVAVYFGLDSEAARTFAGDDWFKYVHESRPWGVLQGLFETTLPLYSQSLLHWFVLPAASVVAGLSAFGGALSKLLPGLRGPLDAALDVDNYFREFPRQRIPRARIFARYAALLDHVASQHYDRIVIVSHSQGTVISAEFLRFLSSRSTAIRLEDRQDRVRDRLGCNVRLLTLGCPLRQLYAARFPTLYRWIVNTDGRPVGPRARDIGAEVWINAFASGDYVGRWLWSAPAPRLRWFHPMIDHTKRPYLGRRTAYDSFQPMPPSPIALARLTEYETCVGFGAHTHYFNPGQHIVAEMIDRLVEP